MKTVPFGPGIRPESLIIAQGESHAMAHLIDRHLIERANAAALLSMVWAALAACVIGAVIYDIAFWLGG